MRKLLPLLTVMAALGASAVPALAQDAKAGDPAAGRKKVDMCIGCHGIPDYKASFPEIYRVPMIAGQGEKYIIAALGQYKKGDRKHPTMRAIAASLTDQDMADLAAFYANEVVGRAQRLVREILERGMETGVFRRMDANVASRMLSALFVTHGTWYHQKNSFKSIANIPEGVLLAQIRDFFLHAMRPEDGRSSPHANT